MLIIFFLSPKIVINPLCTAGVDGSKVLQGLRKNLAEVLTSLRDNTRTKNINVQKPDMNKMISF